MDTGLEALTTALRVTVDDLLKDHPEQAPARPAVGPAPLTSDAEVITLAVVQALLGYTSEARRLRRVGSDGALRAMFPRVPGQSGRNKRVRKLTATMTRVATALRRRVPVADDTVWPADSTPIECARSRPTVMRSDLAGWAEYGYCASHSRFFRGLRLHLVRTVHAPARGPGPGGRQGRRTRDPVRRPGAHGPAAVHVELRPAGMAPSWSAWTSRPHRVR